MPWKTTSALEQRWRFVRLATSTRRGVAELCRRSGISRKTAYKWIARYAERGRRGLRDEVRAAVQLHNRPQPKWLARLKRCKRQHPSWGAPKIRWALRQRFGGRNLLSEAAISRWLKRWGLTRPRRHRPRQGPVMVRPALTQARQPNQVWTIDFKGWFRTGDGTKVEALTVRDLFSRYLLGIELLAQQNMADTRRSLERLFRIYGLPK